MFLKKIKNWITNDEDFTVDNAKAEYEKYKNRRESMLKIIQYAYIQELEDSIKTNARKGKQSIITADTRHDFFTYKFMEEVKEYFENKGFTVKEEYARTGVLKSWLRISWE